MASFILNTFFLCPSTFKIPLIWPLAEWPTNGFNMWIGLYWNWPVVSKRKKNYYTSLTCIVITFISPHYQTSDLLEVSTFHIIRCKHPHLNFYGAPFSRLLTYLTDTSKYVWSTILFLNCSSCYRMCLYWNRSIGNDRIAVYSMDESALYPRVEHALS